MRTRRMTIAVMASGFGLVGTAFLAGGAAAESASGLSAGAGQGEAAHGPLARLVRGQVGRLMTLKADLAISGEQRDQLRGILKGHRDELVPVVKGVAAKREALRTAVLADSPSEGAIRSASEDLGKAIGDAAVVFSKVAGEARTVLTADQLSRLGEFRSDRSARFERFLGEMGGD